MDGNLVVTDVNAYYLNKIMLNAVKSVIGNFVFLHESELALLHSTVQLLQCKTLNVLSHDYTARNTA